MSTTYRKHIYPASDQEPTAENVAFSCTTSSSLTLSDVKSFEARLNCLPGWPSEATTDALKWLTDVEELLPGAYTLEQAVATGSHVRRLIATTGTPPSIWRLWKKRTIQIKMTTRIRNGNLGALSVMDDLLSGGSGDEIVT